MKIPIFLQLRYILLFAGLLASCRGVKEYGNSAEIDARFSAQLREGRNCNSSSECVLVSSLRGFPCGSIAVRADFVNDLHILIRDYLKSGNVFATATACRTGDAYPVCIAGQCETEWR